MMKRTTAEALGCPVAAALILCLCLSGCSSTPKKPPEAVARKNEAADTAKLGDEAMAKGMTDDAIGMYALSVEENRAVDNLDGEAEALLALGEALRVSGDLTGARSAFTQAASISRTSRSLVITAKAGASLAELSLDEGNPGEAKTESEAAAADLASAAKPKNAAETNRADLVKARLSHIGGVLLKTEGDLEGALAALKEAAAIDARLSEYSRLAADHYMMASVHSKRNEYKPALEEAALALENDKKAENPGGIAQDLIAVGIISSKMGDPERAYGYYRRAFETARAAGLPELKAKALERLVETAHALGLAGDEASWTKELEAARKD